MACGGFLPQIVLAEMAAPAESAGMPRITLYADHTPPLRDYDESGVPYGEYVDQVHAFMAESGLAYDIVLFPWSRAYALATNGPHAMVFNLDRIPERESDFIWLKELRRAQYRLFTRNDPALIGLSLDQAISEGRKLLCERDSAQCQMAIRLGFKQEQLIEFVDVVSRNGPIMLVRGRADYFLSNAELLDTELLGNEVEPDQIAPVFDPIIVGSWLAIHKGADPTLIQHMISLRDQSEALARD